MFTLRYIFIYHCKYQDVFYIILFFGGYKTDNESIPKSFFAFFTRKYVDTEGTNTHVLDAVCMLIVVVLQSPVHLTSTRPVMVVQIIQSQTDSSQPADPSMMIIPAAEQYMSYYNLIVPMVRSSYIKLPDLTGSPSESIHDYKSRFGHRLSNYCIISLFFLSVNMTTEYNETDIMLWLTPHSNSGILLILMIVLLHLR